MSTRAQNESRFGGWQELPTGGRLYWVEVAGRNRGSARYWKEVDADEVTVRFWQEIFDADRQLIEIHEKFPIDKGHQRLIP